MQGNSATAASPPQPRSPDSFRPLFSLFGKLCLREITSQTKGSILGFAWLILEPILNMGLYFVVFGLLFGGSFTGSPNETNLHFGLGVYIGLSLVSLVNDTIGQSPGLITGRPNFVKRIVFPLSLLPLVGIAGTGFKLTVNALLWTLLAGILGTLSLKSVLLPVLILPLFLLALGISWMISALGVYFRDIRHVTPVLIQIVFWSGGVFYGAQRLMEVPQVWAILKWNPVFLSVEAARDVLLWNQWPLPGTILYLYVMAIPCCLAGLFLFNRLRHGFSEWI